MWTDAPRHDERRAEPGRRHVCDPCALVVRDLPAALLHEHVRHEGAPLCRPVGAP